jgi:hypothetical protein
MSTPSGSSVLNRTATHPSVSPASMRRALRCAARSQRFSARRTYLKMNGTSFSETCEPRRAVGW